MWVLLVHAGSVYEWREASSLRQADGEVPLTHRHTYITEKRECDYWAWLEDGISLCPSDRRLTLPGRLELSQGCEGKDFPPQCPRQRVSPSSSQSPLRAPDPSPLLSSPCLPLSWEQGSHSPVLWACLCWRASLLKRMALAGLLHFK